MERLIKGRKNGEYQEIVKGGTMRFLDFARVQLAQRSRHSLDTGGREYVLDVFSGSATFSVDSRAHGKQQYSGVGGREDVFSGPPTVVYIPPQSTLEIVAESTQLDVGIFSAPASSGAAPAVLTGPAVDKRVVGRDNWQRTVYSALGENHRAERLLAGETLNPPGNWSSYPPHKHDRANPPQEAVLEEIYFFRVKPPQGYGFIWTYTAPDDAERFSDVFVIEDGDTVLLPRGYHPVVAAPGYQLHYTWALAGEERRYGAWADDPKHAWVKR